MRLVFFNRARKFVGLVALLFFALPFGLSVTGCGHKAAPIVYCNPGDTGPIVGQVATITLSPTLAATGESLNYGQIGLTLSASAADCKGNAVSVKSYTYGSTSSFGVNTVGGPIIADINPSNGQVCGGTWNRNSSGGVPNYTTCTPPATTPTAYVASITAEADGATSNAIPVYVHPVVTGVVLGKATPGALNGSCPANTPDPGTDCCPNDTIGTPVPTPAGVVDGTSCISQNNVGQLVARVYANGGSTAADNITCKVGHITYAAQTPSIVSIDENGAATAQLPGASTITATISNSSAATNAGFFSTCPPASITLSAPGKTNPINVAINTPQPLTATVLDTNGNVITGLNLEFNSTTPQTIPTAVGSVTPLYPGSADITAVCLPSQCNPAPSSQIGLYGNGTPLTSNPITINAVGTSSTVLYMGSTSSQYVALRDFTTNQPSALIKLPYVPNSMVMNQAGTEIYFGSRDGGLMSLSTATNTVTGAVQTITGSVLSVSPDGSTLVVTDPVRQTISLVNASNSTITTSYGGVGTSAAWSPDSQTVYITTTTPTVLTHSLFTDWQSATTASISGEIYTDVAVTVPSVGAYFAGPQTTDGRSYCPASTIASPGPPPVINNQFIPLADESAAITDQLAATTDGNHILGAHAVSGGTSTLSDIDVNHLPADAACPIPPAPQPSPVYFPSVFTTQNLAGINAATITGVVPSSNSAAAFVTYIPPSTNPTTNALLPFYVPPATGQGTLHYLTLGNGATTEAAPLAGVFSTDNFTFYVGTGSSDPTDTTSADNDVHLITMTYPGSGAPTATETGILSPQLPLATGSGYAPVNLIAQHPKKSTS